jgi:hypothetical protein
MTVSKQSECPIFRSWFDDWFDGKISRSRKRLLRRHLSQCGGCLREFEAEKNIIASFRHLPSPSCPESVEDTILARLGLGKVRVRRTSFRKFVPRLPAWEWVSAGAAVLAVLILMTLSTNRNRTIPSHSPAYSEEQIRTASKQAKWSLMAAVGMIQRTEKSIIRNVLLEELPKSLRNTLEKSISMIGGSKP